MRVGHGIDLLGTITRIVPERRPPACDPSRLHTFLIVKLSSIGDVVHALPVACALRERFPSARITWAVEEWAAPLVAGHPALDRVIVFPTMVRWPKDVRTFTRQLKNAVGELRSETYDVALDQFKAGNYSAAIASFNAFVKNYGKSPLAPSAYYWIGNSQFALKDYRAAIATQRQLVAAFPGNPKVPDALLNIATSQFELGDGAASRRTLEELIAKYPQSEAAVKARQRLAIR